MIVYKTTNLINGKIYIGKDMKNNPNYLGSGTILRRAIKKYGIREVKVIVSGPGAGRNAAVKGLDSAGLKITTLIDRTPIAHNGCRPRKSPRK